MHDAVTSQANGVVHTRQAASIGARRPVAGQQLLELIRRDSVGDEETLDLSAIDLTQQRKFLHGFYTFGDHDQTQLTPRLTMLVSAWASSPLALQPCTRARSIFLGERCEHQVHVRAVALAGNRPGTGRNP